MSNENTVTISACELSRFAKKKVRARSIEYYPCAGPWGDPETPSSFSYTAIVEGKVFCVTGEPDGVFHVSDDYAVLMKRTVRKLSPSVNPYSDPAFLAKSLVTAFTFCKSRRLDRVTVILMIEGEGGERYFSVPLTASDGARITDALLKRAAPFAIAKNDFDVRGKWDIEAMPFPYPSIREGQRDFIKEAYRAIKRGERLLVSAPTGIGKTVSALFPAVKALGEGTVDKIFYLTAKTVTGLAAAKTVEAMRRFVPDLRAVMISAKERTCPSNDKKIDFFVDRCTFDCPRVSDTEEGEYSARRDEALKELLSSEGVYDKNAIRDAAEKYGLCPYELSLDLSEYCQVVICDYNYAFDPSVKFRRYFSEGGLSYVFLIDEAHNLPDRARDTFSCAIEKSEAVSAADKLASSPFPDAELISSFRAFVEALDSAGEECLKEARLEGGETYGYSVSDEVPKELIKAAEKLSRPLGRARDSKDGEVSSIAKDFYPKISDLMKSAEYFGDGFVFFTELKGEELTARAMCLDPSHILDRAMSGARSAILFSATLTPAEYFSDVTGCRGAPFLELESPYSPDNLAVAIIDSVSTKYLSRGDTASEVAEAIIAAIGARNGHYIVYFPSYKYMQTVFDAFCVLAPKGVSALVQKPSMSLDARRKFLSFFENSDGETLVGFCVLGGVFSEGIDLPDDRLIGAILVGIGLPSLSSELNILKDYYDRTRDGGFEFAYLYPALIKISQAAGRVIRDEKDRGVIVLIDERYRDPGVVKLLPPHWKNIHIAGNAASLSLYLSKFWEKG